MLDALFLLADMASDALAQPTALGTMYRHTISDIMDSRPTSPEMPDNRVYGLSLLLDAAPEDGNPNLSQLKEYVAAERANSSARASSRASGRASSHASEERGDAAGEGHHTGMEWGDEPKPQRANTNSPDPLLQYWQNRNVTSYRDQASPQSQPKTLTSLREKAKKMPEWSRHPQYSLEMAEKSLMAKRSKKLAENDAKFWHNRVKMLNRELERANTRVEKLRMKGNRFEVSQVLNETVASQLAEEKKRDKELRKEKADAIRVHKMAHKASVRDAQDRMIQERIEMSHLQKAHSRNHRNIVDTEKYEDFQKRCHQRERIQQDKIVALLRRVKDHAMHEEETRRNYERKVEHLRQEEDEFQSRTVEMITQSSKLVEKIRSLRAMEANSMANVTAVRSLNTKLYSGMAGDGHTPAGTSRSQQSSSRSKKS